MPVPLDKQLTQLWQSGESTPDVFAFLNEHAGASAAEAVDVIVADQRSRWRTSQPLRVEDYLAKLPSLALDRPARLALAIGEFQARLASGTVTDIDEFTRRFSDLAVPLRSQLAALVADSSPSAGGEPITATHVSTTATRDAVADTIAPAEGIGRYRILRLLGAGSFGRVWLGSDDELRRQVAIKVPAPDRFRRPEDSQAYLAEARILATLDHPHIVPVYDLGRTAEGSIYVVSKFVPGQNLAERIRKQPLRHEESARLVATIADALDHAHNLGLVHRDIKPANLLIEEPTQRPYVADFGLAIRGAAHGGDDPIAGTPAYMSPEQTRGEGPLDGRSDIFSLGVVLYELLCGRRPFGGATAGELFSQITSRAPVPLHELDDKIPLELERICRRALAKRADDRYQAASEFAAELRAWLQRQLADARPVSHNLPAPISPLIGREQDVDAVKRLLAESRLVTLTGPGGIGKTRLGIEIARELLSEFPGGVFLVELAAIRASDLVASAIAQVVDCREQPGMSTVECLCERFAGARVLLVLDNFEHVLEAAGVASDLLAACPALKVLMTSRAPVHIVGEQEYPLPLLACPDPASPPPWEEAAAYSAVALFAQRARAASPDFQLNRENAGAIAEICARLDGLPLAIELAASWIKVLPLAALRERLQKRLSLPASRRSTTPLRQQTLRSAIAWSYDLLDPAEQRLFLRLAVFEGGCTLDAAEAVVPPNAQRVDVLDGMASLVDKSLLRLIERSSGTARYSMLETVREFALEGLAASGEEEAIRRAHA
ncbi:MAG TPA: protein kinase, partial [Pirellulaceae bacterium]|nr:protein kinase [Pirellulaceae bacterium]